MSVTQKSDKQFRVVRGKDEIIQKFYEQEKKDGYVYFAYDTKQIYLGDNGKLIPMGASGGGSGVDIYYGSNYSPTEDEETGYFLIPFEYLDNQDELPQLNDLILMSDNNSLFRIVELSDEGYLCKQISGGAGEEAASLRPSVTIDWPASKIVNNSSAKVSFTATSMLDEFGNPLDQELNVTYYLFDASDINNPIQYRMDTFKVPSGVLYGFDLGPYLRKNTINNIEFYFTGDNHDTDKPVKKTSTIRTTELALNYVQGFSQTTIYEAKSDTLSCDVTTSIDSILELYIDDNLIDSRKLNEGSAKEQQFPFSTTHGYHVAQFELYQDVNGEKFGDPVKLTFEFAATEVGAIKPIIWLGAYKEEYATYDDIQIPYFVWDTNNTTIVSLYKKNIKYAEHEVNTTLQYIWEIADADELQINKYQISCGDNTNPEKYTEREIIFEMVVDEKRTGMVIAKQDNLQWEFTAKGRSNTEPAAARQTYTFANGTYANFKNFNWLNNGWMMDSNRQSYLKISNGARLEIPVGTMQFNGSSNTNRNFSMEVQFKITNIQNYNNLIKNITRYKFADGSTDEELYQEFINPELNNKYDNYDAFLQDKLKEAYDSLIFDKVQRNIDLTNIVCGYFTPNNKVGIAIGTQDTFFSNGLNTLSIPFVEEELVTVSYVYDYKSVTYNNGKAIRYMYIYVNGVISGVIKSEKEDIISIEPENGVLFFNSDTCDIDLYKIRIYNTTLNVIDVIVNYAVDHKDPNIYDQAQLAKNHQTLGEYQFDYQLMLNYNAEHPDQMLMPYIIYDTTESNDDILPYRKPPAGEKGKKINVEFVNTILDKMYQNGELEELAIKDKLIANDADSATKAEAVKLYYKHHCPSFIANGIDFTVQGTSSEFYPRRNYKIKTKVNAEIWNEDKQQFEEDSIYNIMMNRGPYASIYQEDLKAVAADAKLLGQEESRCADGWYMNNYTNGTDRWTMKVDYMESSGSYNAGFASMIGTAYSKHPLEDYYKKGAMSNTDKLKPKVTFIDSSLNSIHWEDFRTSLLGFPVIAFQKKKGNDGKPEYLFLGYYRMLLDKGSDEVLGFKTNKKITSKILKDEKGKAMKMRDVAECWEFSTNARTYTSYRDPWDRVELSFMPPESAINDKTGLTADGAPLICNHIEYRYTKDEDYLDILQKLVNKETNESLVTIEDGEFIEAELGFNPRNDLQKARQAVVDMYSNWEDVSRWVNKTDMDAVISEGIYSEIKLGANLFQSGIYYIQNENFEMVPAFTYEEGKEYFEKKTVVEDGISKEIYTNAYVVNNPDYVYSAYKFYIKDGENYYLSSDTAFSDITTYYIQEKNPDIALYANRLVKLCEDEAYNPEQIYYNYNKEQTNENVRKGNLAVTVADITEDDYAPGKYYIAAPITYGSNRTYEFDSKEYRAEKFTNEINKHFDMEYLATYFVATEVFECYDSRGKNCMMASWGPQTVDGNYIWYPIFYDIDTQLGINNTGIPSFEFNVDATENFNYSTSDSILWNNFYRFFKGSYIKNKYNHMKGESAGGWGKLNNPPMKDGVNTLEKWYTFDYDINKNIACKGIRPLITTNLDEYFKYITITNPKAVEAGVAYLNGEGKFVDPNKEDTTGFFYALQGDRNQSRRQFLTNRLDYIDSWLNVGNYARAGNNRIRGRISANYGLSDNESNRINSDIYLASKDGYFDESGNKLHEFDAEYWLNLKPIRSSYVTAGDDSANYPSKKYDGINPVRFELTDLAPGIKDSPNYAEQLCYIYGMKNMSDVGDMSKLYWREFYMEGAADKLTRLKLGHDGIGSDPNNPRWYNKQLNGIFLTNLPLLKEANFCNITLSNDTTLPLTASEKLEDFRATGMSGLDGVNFADGVALHTLYLPSCIKSLKLNEAKMLTNVIKDYKPPEKNSNGELTAERGLYLEGLFEGNSSIALSTINLQGGSLGYGSHAILRQYCELKKTTGGNITMTNVDWCPYSLMTEGSIYDSTKENYYFIDNGHYGFEPFIWKNEQDFKAKIANQELYCNDKNLSQDIINSVNIDTLTLLKNFTLTTTPFKDASGIKYPEFSGIIYINNDDEQINELDIPNILQKYYPNMKFFFSNVKKVYSAKFVIYDENTGIYEYVRVKDDPSAISVQKIDGITKVWFDNPYDIYLPEKTHYDFQGWKILGANDEDIIIETEWNSQVVDIDKYTYIFCAVFEVHSYNIKFYDQFDNLLEENSIPYNTNLIVPSFIPYQDDSQLLLKQTYDFQGWSLSKTGKIINPSTYIITSDEVFYAIFKLVEDCTKVIHYDWFNFDLSSVQEANTGVPGHTAVIEGYVCSPKVSMKGKITIPRKYNGKDVIRLSSFNNNQQITHVFMEKGIGRAPLAQIDAETFQGQDVYNPNPLKYFNFADTSLRIIYANAFKLCSLEASLMELDTLDSLFYVDEFAFQGGITFNNPTTLILPSNLEAIAQGAFTYFSNNSGISNSILQIGTASKPSKLNLSLRVNSVDQFNRFEQNADFQSIYFYSNLYTQPTEIVTTFDGSPVTVQDAFQTSTISIM